MEEYESFLVAYQDSLSKLGITEGYRTASEFYSPNYSELPPEPDYRRTLYWNPMVATGETGMTNIRFYNNSRAMNFSINAETITSQGMIGVYKK
jgi:uracil phosphoribosyltransferase